MDGRAPRLRMTLELPGLPISATIARHLVRAGLATAGTPDLDPIELITSELVANAISCTGDDITVTLTTLAGGAVLLEVADLGTGWPEWPGWGSGPGPGSGSDSDSGSGPAERIGGLGLPIVDALATRWGCVANPGPGKTVWVESRPRTIGPGLAP
jgi:anti-sigma regulatory factor (Ser/Thr protein kinase)